MLRGAGVGPAVTPSCGAHLAEAIDAEVPAGPALVAGRAVHHSVLQLVRKGLVQGPAVQLAGFLWGHRCRFTMENRAAVRGPPGRPPPPHARTADRRAAQIGCSRARGSARG